MRSINRLSCKVARRVCCVLTDVDGTLTQQGKLTSSAYLGLWDLRAAGISVVVVTGRPAGWCDMMARQWPVDGVIGENGALAFFELNGRLDRLYHPEVRDTKAIQDRLEAVREAVLKEVPESRVAKDQPYRLFDLAIDFAEEPPELDLERAYQIRDVFHRFGAHAKVSSIHVNGWFGDYDKLSMVQLFARERWGEAWDGDTETCMFTGDSPNDAPLFGFFSHSVGMANLKPFVSRIESLPRYLTRHEGGEGFAEFVKVLLARRGQV